MTYRIKDSGERQEFEGGAMRDTEEGKLDYSNLIVWFEPMGTRYVQHMTAGRAKYPDPEPGVPNWSLFEATEENLHRTLRSLDRHYKQYRMGETDEDHAAAILFNLNLAEKIRAALEQDIAWDRFADYAEEAEAMLDDPTFDEPVEMTPDEIRAHAEEAASPYANGDIVRLNDRRIFYRDLVDDSIHPIAEEEWFPSVVTLTKPESLVGAERAWEIEEDRAYIVEEQIESVVGVDAGYAPANHTDPFQYEEASIT